MNQEWKNQYPLISARYV